MTEYGYCRCGCGEETPIAKRTITCRGWIKGEPRSYVPGHHIRMPRSVAWKKSMSKPGSKNANWKGPKAGYSAIHYWLERNHPKTGICETCGKEGSKTHYASLTNHFYIRHRLAYAELCPSCHLRFDRKVAA